MKKLLLLLTASVIIIAEFIPTSHSDETSYAQALHFYQADDYTQAAKLFKAFRDSTTVPELQRKAACYYAMSEAAQSNLPAAAAGYTYFLENFPESEFTVFITKKLINILININEYPQALFLLYRLEKEPLLTLTDQEVIQSNKIFCFARLGQLQNADYTISEFTTLFPASDLIPQFLFWQGWYRQTLNNFAEAEQLYDAVIATNTNQDITRQAKINKAVIYLKTDKTGQAAELMLSLINDNYDYPAVNMLWLASYFGEIRELNIARKLLNKIIRQADSPMLAAIARKDLCEILTASREFHYALSNYPLIKKDLLEAQSSIAQIDYLNRLADYANAHTLRKLGSSLSALTILNQLKTNLSDPLYYNIIYEQGMIALELNNQQEAAAKLMQVGILSKNPDLAGKALLNCYEACKMMENIHLSRICLEELTGKNSGSYGQLHPNSPYTAQAQELLKELQ